jgi:hypothetical protein
MAQMIFGGLDEQAPEACALIGGVNGKLSHVTARSSIRPARMGEKPA